MDQEQTDKTSENAILREKIIRALRSAPASVQEEVERIASELSLYYDDPREQLQAVRDNLARRKAALEKARIAVD